MGFDLMYGAVARPVIGPVCAVVSSLSGLPPASAQLRIARGGSCRWWSSPRRPA